jgi:ABC-type branched-subunit amino acid transport system ATPase component
MSLLQTQAISKSFGGLMAVNDCTFEVEKGSITALIGPNGAGKTTVFNLISGCSSQIRGASLMMEVGLMARNLTR